MKLLTFELKTAMGSVQRIGALIEHKLVDLNMGYICYLAREKSTIRAHELANVVLPPNMIAFFKSNKEGREAAETTIEYIEREQAKYPIYGPRGERIVFDTNEVKIMAPVPRPNSLRDYIGFEGHVSFSGQRQVPEAWYQIPVCYKGNPDTVIGPDETISWPSFTDLLDYELEYGIYIGKEGINIPRERAKEYIAGYTIFNDISARDIQLQEMMVGLGPVKGKDTCSIMGPCLVTPDEIDDSNLHMIARINGAVQVENNSGNSYWTWPQIIEFASMDETLHPGDFMGSGTVEKGCGLETGIMLQPGDVVELEVEGIGVLRNRVGDRPPKRTFFR